MRFNTLITGFPKYTVEPLFFLRNKYGEINVPPNSEKFDPLTQTMISVIEDNEKLYGQKVLFPEPRKWKVIELGQKVGLMMLMFTVISITKLLIKVGVLRGERFERFDRNFQYIIWD